MFIRSEGSNNLYMASLCCSKCGKPASQRYSNENEDINFVLNELNKRRIAYTNHYCSNCGLKFKF